MRKLLLAPLAKGYWYAGIAIPDWRYVSPMSIVDPRAKMELSKALSPGYALCKSVPASPSSSPVRGRNPGAVCREDLL